MPIGGKKLSEMRLQGVRPMGFLVVTESSEIAKNAREKELYPLIFEPKSTYDWTVVYGLDVGLATYLRREEVAALCLDILNAGPSSFAATYFNDDPLHDTILAIH